MKAKEHFQALITIIIPYIHKILSLIMFIFLFTIVIGDAVFKWKKLSFTTAISLSITVNIVYMACYFFPRMLVGFTNNPLQATYGCCMFTVRPKWTWISKVRTFISFKFTNLSNYNKSWKYIICSSPRRLSEISQVTSGYRQIQ